MLWLWGNASTGKSYFMRRISKIFASTEVAWKGEYLPAKGVSRPEIVSQLVTCEEFDFFTAFGLATLETTKQLFEGRSGLTRVGPYKQYGERFGDACFVLASNTLPNDEAKK